MGKITRQELHPSVGEMLVPLHKQELFEKQHGLSLGDGLYDMRLNNDTNEYEIKYNEQKIAHIGMDGLYMGGHKLVTVDDTRLVDARTPVGHRESHFTGGSDAIHPSDIGAEPEFEKKTAFNKDFGLGPDKVLNETHLTKENVGLGSVDNYSRNDYDALYAHQDGEYANLRAMATTKADVGLGNVDNYSLAEYDLRYAMHEGTYPNLRAQGTLKEDVGLGNVDNYSKADYDQLYASQQGEYENLRAQATTKEDVGLGNVDNYSRTDYDGRYAQKTGNYPLLQAGATTKEDVGLGALTNDKQATEFDFLAHQATKASGNEFGHVKIGGGISVTDGVISTIAATQLTEDALYLKSPDGIFKKITVGNDSTISVLDLSTADNEVNIVLNAGWEANPDSQESADAYIVSSSWTAELNGSPVDIFNTHYTMTSYDEFDGFMDETIHPTMVETQTEDYGSDLANKFVVEITCTTAAGTGTAIREIPLSVG